MENIKKVDDFKSLAENLGKVAYILDKAYLPRLRIDYSVFPFNEYAKQLKDKDGELKIESNVRLLQVSRWAYDKEELIRDGFKNVLGLFAGGEHNVALIIRRTPLNTEVYFAVKNELFPGAKEANTNVSLLNDSLVGNFCGSKTDIFIKNGNDIKGRERTSQLLNFDDTNAISALCGIPSEKSEDYISQGIDKLLNGIVPKTDSESYTVIILAQPMTITDLRGLLSEYETIASSLAPFAEKQLQFGKSITDTTGTNKSDAHTTGNAYTKTKMKNVNVNTSVSTSDLLPVSISVGGGFGYSWGNAITDTINDTASVGTSVSLSNGETENTSFTDKSYMVAGIIAKLEATIKRINESQSTGLWKTGAYVISASTDISRNAANFLGSIMQGELSFLEPTFIQTWFRSDKGDDYDNILQYIRHITHPVFNNKRDGNAVFPTANVSTTELSNLFAFPRFSVQGLPILDCVRFGRESHGLVSLKKDLEIGFSYHMRQCESNRIFLDKKELTKHTFITGSTGSGKSNTVYTLLNKLCPKNGQAVDTKFLIIEPAKGEYKDVFGGRDDVTTYGTNPFKFPHLLQINPFSFPDDIHVLEHIDRLVEVFNACWPMYAAMPAILREAVEKSYERVDWNLKKSKNPGRFPTFEKLLAVLPGVIESSEYSADTSSDYKGALKTRVRSLTRGIHGAVFNDDIDPAVLFNQNVIVDISRVGSSETKALIMGVLILKLQEFRMSEDKHNSKELRHVTVLEEAHNLLRRTSSEQSQESSNLQSKSVEMLANAIAEMRTFGEGFIIVDQSPGLMDMSVIRNTNTKIILRLPDENDRLLVGKAAGLSDLQITELSRMEVGVAAISQSDWLEPVLCKVDEFKDDISLAKRYKDVKFGWDDTESDALQQFLNIAFDVERVKLSQDVADKVRAWCDTVETKEAAHSYIEMVLEGNPLSGEQKMVVAAAITGNRICTIPDRETAVSEVVKSLIGQYDFKESDEIIRRVNDLFLVHFPANIYIDRVSLDEIHESGVK